MFKTLKTSYLLSTKYILKIPSLGLRFQKLIQRILYAFRCLYSKFTYHYGFFVVSTNSLLLDFLMVEEKTSTSYSYQITSLDPIMIVFLTLMFSIGMGGNIWAMICVLWIWCKKKLPKRGVFRHMSAYIFLLSVSDVFVSFRVLCMIFRSLQ